MALNSSEIDGLIAVLREIVDCIQQGIEFVGTGDINKVADTINRYYEDRGTHAPSPLTTDI